MIILFFLLLNPQPALAGPSLERYYNSAQPPKAVSVPATEPVADTAAKPATPTTGPGGGAQVVTSIQKCYADIGTEAAQDIRRRSLTPYADCQKRLREKIAADKAAAAVPEAETPRNYRRVTQEQPIDADVPPKTKKAMLPEK